jgi:hypothetical protein
MGGASTFPHSSWACQFSRDSVRRFSRETCAGCRPSRLGAGPPAAGCRFSREWVPGSLARRAVARAIGLRRSAHRASFMPTRWSASPNAGRSNRPTNRGRGRLLGPFVHRVIEPAEDPALRTARRSVRAPGDRRRAGPGPGPQPLPTGPLGPRHPEWRRRAETRPQPHRSTADERIQIDRLARRALRRHAQQVALPGSDP